MLFNSTVSTPGDRFCTFYIEDFYCGSPMRNCEYMSIKLAAIPQEIIYQYDFEVIHHEVWVYIEIQKVMPVLKQAGNISNEHMCAHLKKYGYAPVLHTPVLWKHESRNIMFTLVMDDSGIKFTSRRDIEHLGSALKDLYVITKDWEGTKILGLNLNWDYTNRTVDVSIPKYFKAALHKFQHPTPLKP